MQWLSRDSGGYIALPDDLQSDVLLRSARLLAYACLLFVTPFALNNLFQGRWLLGAGSSFIVLHFAFNAWTISRQGRYHYLPVLLLLAPAIVSFLFVSVRVQGTIGLLWCFPAAVALYFMLPERLAHLANVALLAVVLPTAAREVDPAIAVRFGATLLLVVVFTGMFVRLLVQQEQELRVQAVTDPLTGLFNRALLEGTVAQAVARSRRSGTEMTVLALDIDHFKRVNDTAGHEVGDEVIRALAAVLRSRVRRTDTAFRVGGEEFLVLMFDAGHASGVRLAEALRCAIETDDAVPGHSVTVSVGVATLGEDESPADWLRRADDNLYAAKADGRNTVVG